MGEQLAGVHRPVQACLGGGLALLAVGLGCVVWAANLGKQNGLKNIGLNNNKHDNNNTQLQNKYLNMNKHIRH